MCRAAIVGLVVCTLGACDQAPAVKDVVGIYSGRYAGGTEVFDIRLDGTFTQTFVRNGNEVYSSAGKWWVSEVGSGVCFAPYVQPYQMMDPDSWEPDEFDMARKQWLPSGKLIIWSDGGYVVYRN